MVQWRTTQRRATCTSDDCRIRNGEHLRSKQRSTHGESLSMRQGQRGQMSGGASCEEGAMALNTGDVKQVPGTANDDSRDNTASSRRRVCVEEPSTFHAFSCIHKRDHVQNPSCQAHRPSAKAHVGTSTQVCPRTTRVRETCARAATLFISTMNSRRSSWG